MIRSYSIHDICYSFLKLCSTSKNKSENEASLLVARYHIPIYSFLDMTSFPGPTILGIGKMDVSNGS